MKTWDAIRSRRNVRNYKPEPVPEEDVRQILKAGRRAPSGGNNQHWDFIVVTDRQQLAQLATVWQGAQFIASAPAAIALVMPHPVDPDALNTDEYDLGQATYAMTLAATARLIIPSRPDAPRWLFPGRIPGQMLDLHSLNNQLNRHGISARPARNRALAALASDLPAAVLADFLGIHVNTAVRWVTYARKD
jgi:nitroreductase